MPSLNLENFCHPSSTTFNCEPTSRKNDWSLIYMVPMGIGSSQNTQMSLLYNDLTENGGIQAKHRAGGFKLSGPDSILLLLISDSKTCVVLNFYYRGRYPTRKYILKNIFLIVFNHVLCYQC